MSRVRTFIALDLDAVVRGRLVTLQEQLARSGPEVKWVEPENLHVTLLFLGEVREKELAAVCRAVSATAQPRPAFALRLTGLGGFPNLRRPRTLWVGVGDGAEAVCSLHAGLEDVLFELGCYRRENRPYTPHVTLGRLTGDGGADVSLNLPTGAAKWTAGVTQVREVLVMSSELRPAGPEYSVIGRGKFQGRPTAKGD
jgi:RNA 2',3'-cyclic 3'-phosphodiesterase